MEIGPEVTECFSISFCGSHATFSSRLLVSCVPGTRQETQMSHISDDDGSETISTTSHVPTAFLSASQLLILTGTALRELTNIRTGQGTTKSSRLGSEGLKLPSRIGRHLGLSASHPAPTSPAAGRPKSFLTLALPYLRLQGSLHIPTCLSTCSIKIALK